MFTILYNNVIILKGGLMDNIDIKIINSLRNNSRVNASDIAEKVNLSVSAVIERIKKLESSGIIKQYTVVLDTNKLGKDVMALISVSIEHPKFNETFVESVMQNPQIVECHYIAGDFDFLLKVITESTQTLEKILNDIKCVNGVSKTKTMIVLSTIKNDLSISLKKVK
jgi:Lrp/AsnC family leucine-responsive transcriptional regulator